MKLSMEGTAGDMFPPEALEMILLNLSPRALLKAKQTCRHWSDFIDGSLHLQRAMFLRPAHPSEYLLWQTTATKPEWHTVISPTPVNRSAGTGTPSNLASMVISEANPALPAFHGKYLPKTYMELQLSSVDLKSANAATLLIQPPCFRCTMQRRRGQYPGGHETDVINANGITILDVMLAAMNLGVVVLSYDEAERAGDGEEGSAPVDEEPVHIFLDLRPADIYIRIPDHIAEDSELVQKAREAAAK